MPHPEPSHRNEERMGAMTESVASLIRHESERSGRAEADIKAELLAMLEPERPSSSQLE